MRYLLLLLSLNALALAQTLHGPAEVTAFVESASFEIRLYAPVLRNKTLAEALRVALRERGVRVRIFTPYMRDKGSYFLALSLAGAVLYPVGEAGSPAVLWVDGRYLIVGPLVAAMGEPLEQALTQVFQNPETLRRYQAWFDQLQSNARAFLPSRDLLGLFSLPAR